MFVRLNALFKYLTNGYIFHNMNSVKRSPIRLGTYIAILTIPMGRQNMSRCRNYIINEEF